MKKPLALGLCVLMLTLGACTRVTTLRAENSLQLSEYDIYSVGSRYASLSATPHGMVQFSQAPMYGINLETPQTARGLSLHTPDAQLLALYGDEECEIQYRAGGRWITLNDITLQEWRRTEQYQCDYIVTFFSYVVGGRVQQDDARLVQTYASADNSTELLIYSLCFTVKNGAVAEIESCVTSL